MNLENYSNLDAWVAILNGRITAVLSSRLRHAISTWCEEFGKSDNAGLANGDVQESSSPSHLSLEPLLHEIRIRNQVIYLDPPIEVARAEWLYQYQDAVGIVCDLPTIRSSRYEISLRTDDMSADELTYVSILATLDNSTLAKPLELIEDKVQTVSEYVDKWLRFQSLWDLEAEDVYSRLGESLSRWGELLADIRQARSTFDTSDTRKDFGVIAIDYANAQSKVNAKYDSWQRDLLARYGVRLGTAMKDTYAAISKSRSDLELLSIDSTSTAQAVSFITLVQDLKRKVVTWGPDIDEFVAGQKTLERQRFAFGADWLHVDQVQGEWSAFTDILKRKDDSIQEQIGQSKRTSVKIR